MCWPPCHTVRLGRSNPFTSSNMWIKMVVPALYCSVSLITWSMVLKSWLRSLMSIKCSDISTRNLALFDVVISDLLCLGLTYDNGVGPFALYNALSNFISDVAQFSHCFLLSLPVIVTIEEPRPILISIPIVACLINCFISDLLRGPCLSIFLLYHRLGVLSSIFCYSFVTKCVLTTFV